MNRPGGRASYASLAVGVLFIAVIVGAGIYFAGRRANQALLNASGNDGSREASVIEVGGVVRPARDLVRSRKADFGIASDAGDNLDTVGKTPMISPDANAEVQATYDQLVSSQPSDSVNPLLSPPPFNPREYQADPSVYLSQSVPGRVWQTGQPGEGVDPIARLSDRLVEMKQGESVRLQVQSAPHFPVTFTSFDLGAFQNHLASVTVEADDRGVAEAVFTATGGTIANVHILAASPVASGTARFLVHVSESIQ